MTLAITATAFLLAATPAPKISPLLSDVAHKPATAMCGALPQANNADPSGWVPTVGGNVAYLAPWVCAALVRQQRHLKVDSAVLGEATFVMIHEGNHLRGTANEAQADCDALHQMPGLIRKWWKLNRSQVHEAMMYAWDQHQRSGPVYQGLC